MRTAEAVSLGERMYSSFAGTTSTTTLEFVIQFPRCRVWPHYEGDSSTFVVGSDEVLEILRAIRDERGHSKLLTCQHAADHCIDPFDAFLCPGGTDANDAVRYLARVVPMLWSRASCFQRACLCASHRVEHTP